MKWLASAYRRCLEWVRDRLWPPTLVLRREKIRSPSGEVVRTCPAERVETTMRIKTETPPGIARLAAILSECAHDPVVSTRGGLAGNAAPDH